MKNNFDQGYFIERLTVLSLLLFIYPRLVLERLNPGRSGKRVYFFDGSKAAETVASFFLRPLRIRLERLQFRIVDIKDEDGKLLRLRISYQDLDELQKNIITNSVFRKIMADSELNDKMKIFFKKQTSGDMLWLRSQTAFRAFSLVQVAVWKLKQCGSKDFNAVFFMNRRVWQTYINKYAEKYGISIIWVRLLRIDWRMLVEQSLGISRARCIRNLFIYISNNGLVPFVRNAPWRDKGTLIQERKIISISDKSPRLAVEYYGHLNLDKPELHSDFFFWQQSQLSGKDILAIFGLPRDPFNQEKKEQFAKYGMKAVSLHPSTTVVSSAPVFYHWPRTQRIKPLQDIPASQERRWFYKQRERYAIEFDYWLELFKRCNVKLYLSWYKYDARHCFISDALQNLGGINAVYQRAFEELPSPETTIVSDIVFGFSPFNAEVERRNGSDIRYHVAVGYFGDHRFSLLKPYAREIRHRLQQHGAEHIIAFFDENSGADSRWHTGHEFMRVNYQFLLEKVLREPRLGVLFKPKVPVTLRQRLGPVAELLKRAEETGRCFVFEGGALHGSYPPAIAALAADVVVHGHLCAATAGLEAALTGVPTLLIDREGWPESTLYRLGKGRVVFNDWQELWKKYEEYLKIPGGIPGFGDWSSIIDELDPFRDGRAAERIGTYLKWLMDGFKAGLSRETVLADAAERYCKIWGSDKVNSVSPIDNLGNIRKCETIKN